MKQKEQGKSLMFLYKTICSHIIKHEYIFNKALLYYTHPHYSALVQYPPDDAPE